MKQRLASGQQRQRQPTVLTIGHSTRALEEFIQLLQGHEVTCVVDVRTVPRSRHNPQFNRETLPQALKGAGIAFHALPGLGGFRRSADDSINTAWENHSFRGFADYMQTREFEHSLNELIALAREQRVVLMCAEAVPWRCHRSLIADALLARGIATEHILSDKPRQPHVFPAFAKVSGTSVTYPGTHGQDR